MRRERSRSFAIRSIAWTRRECPISIGRCRQVVEELHDRGPIEPRSSRDLISFVAESLQPDQTTADRDPRPRLTPDRGLIVARSWPDRGPIVPRLGLFLKRNSSRFIPDLKPQSHAIETASTTLENRLHDRFNWPRSSDQFPSLKACISLLCSLTFDRLVKKLSEFRGRS